MERRVTIEKATADFRDLLRDVQAGGSVLIEEAGRVIARVEPAASDDTKRAEGYARVSEHARSLPVRVVGDWKREDLYD